MRKSIVGGVLIAVAAALVAGSAAGPARAYGPLAVYQIGLSFNCNNPSVCGPSLGGFWGWAEFDSDNTGDAQLTGCEHMQGGPAAGAQHFSVDATGWTIAPGSAGPATFFVTSEVDTFVGRGGKPTVVTIPSEFFDTGISAVPGHYSSQTLFGMSAPPGTNFEIQVAKIPNH